jgi:hypothetical protein
MCGGKCGGKGKLCPVSLGLAVGITAALAVFIWMSWMVYYGVPPTMASVITAPTIGGAFIHALWALLKGFLFGFFVALFYDFISCCCKGPCCKKGECSCGCCTTTPPEKKM